MTQDRDDQSPTPHTPETAAARRGRFIGVGLARGMALGISVGTLLGVLLFDNPVFGLPIGGLGTAIGGAVGARRAATAEHSEAGEDPPQPGNGSTR